METLTEPMTRGLMEAAEVGKPPATWTQPADIKTAPAFVLSHKISSNGEIVPSPSTDIYPSWYTGGSTKTSSSTQTIDKVSGKVATSCTPALAKVSQANGNAATWNADIFNGGKANTGSTVSSSTTTTSATDDVHNCNDSPPTITLTAPSDCDSASGCNFTVTASQGTHDLEGGTYTTDPAGTIVISVNGQAVKTFTMDQPDVFSASYNYNPTSSGSVTVTATVVDSVLYSGTSTQTVNMSAATPLSSVTTSTSGGGTVTISWNGGTGPFTVYKTATNAAVSANCTDTTNNSCTVSGPALPSNTKFYVKDSSDGTVVNGTT
jgi:hypothetical protein